MRPLAAALALAAGLLGLGACSGSTSSDPLVKATAHVSGTLTTVQLPTGRLQVEVAKPASVVSAADAFDGRKHTAPAGKTYLGVTWQYQSSVGVPTWEGPLVADGQGVAVTMALAVGGHDYRIGTTTSAPIDSYVLVPDHGDPQVAVTFDGLTQRIDVATGSRQPSAADLLYGDQPGVLQARSCAQGDWGAHLGGLTCSYTVGRMPYLPRLGWRPGGWTVVGLGTQVASVRESGRDYPVTGIADASTLGGAAPVATLLPTDQAVPGAGRTLQGFLVFAGGSGPLTIVRTLTLGGDAGRHPARPTVRVSNRAAL
jgi:hypothetical protein